MNIYLQFIIACTIIIISGIKLTKYGDDLEEKAGLSAGFIGAFLLAACTSLPELVASFSSVYILNAPQLALGNIFGSNIFNLTILAVLDLFFIKECLYHKVDKSIVKTIAIGQILTVFALFGIALNNEFTALHFEWNSKSIFNMNVFLLLVLITYTFTASLITEDDEEEEEAKPVVKVDANDKWKAILKFAITGVIVTVSGVWLTYTCDIISDVSGLGKTFIGSLLLAFATSLPEATVCLTALKMRAYTLVFGNVLGSNIFNIFILAVTDLFSPHLNLLNIENINLNFITGFCSFLLSSMVLLAIFYKGKRKKMELISILIIIAYFVSYYIMFVQTKS
ncbi:MAG: sodium:calcium antiporter [Candidatus Cloacimonetes bacterium]|nr:sodium:calcium antiporter [Candidatus Cloacimonadota bacterium]